MLRVVDPQAHNFSKVHLMQVVVNMSSRHDCGWVYTVMMVGALLYLEYRLLHAAPQPDDAAPQPDDAAPQPDAWEEEWFEIIAADDDGVRTFRPVLWWRSFWHCAFADRSDRCTFTCALSA
jgi:hypothetical protein